jgi:hypothetical protein
MIASSTKLLSFCEFVRTSLCFPPTFGVRDASKTPLAILAKRALFGVASWALD